METFPNLNVNESNLSLSLAQNDWTKFRNYQNALMVVHDPISPLKFKMPHLESYRDKANPTDHFANFESMMLLMGINYALKC
ncbi:hypothetical protein IEQ34_010499 [Dendrobium chrysotoxum]|uniref:Uncharacterized protein n=1 Tax=Dendrobium chrysotoxum TaxID=161865 RepID=A0AAV7GT39_DENCH|nr:hypothetical protein IEQ34_010499 [Dendrobium chrysotoxum]